MTTVHCETCNTPFERVGKSRRRFCVPCAEKRERACKARENAKRQRKKADKPSTCADCGTPIEQPYYATRLRCAPCAKAHANRFKNQWRKRLRRNGGSERENLAPPPGWDPRPGRILAKLRDEGLVKD
jgi:protein-arginine kinase activator protein McsA